MSPVELTDRERGGREDGEEAKSCDGKKAWCTINHSILSGPMNKRPALDLVFRYLYLSSDLAILHFILRQGSKEVFLEGLGVLNLTSSNLVPCTPSLTYSTLKNSSYLMERPCVRSCHMRSSGMHNTVLYLKI